MNVWVVRKNKKDQPKHTSSNVDRGIAYVVETKQKKKIKIIIH